MSIKPITFPIISVPPAVSHWVGRRQGLHLGLTSTVSQPPDVCGWISRLPPSGSDQLPSSPPDAAAPPPPSPRHVSPHQLHAPRHDKSCATLRGDSRTCGGAAADEAVAVAVAVAGGGAVALAVALAVAVAVDTAVAGGRCGRQAGGGGRGIETVTLVTMIWREESSLGPEPSNPDVLCPVKSGRGLPTTQSIRRSPASR